MAKDGIAKCALFRGASLVYLECHVEKALKSPEVLLPIYLLNTRVRQFRLTTSHTHTPLPPRCLLT